MTPYNNISFTHALVLQKIDDDLITPGNQEELLPCYLYKTFSEIHNSNLLNVKTQNIDVKRLLVDDGEYQITQIPTIVTGSADKSVKFTSLLTGETFNIFEFHKAGVLSIDFHPIYKNLMLTSSIDSTFHSILFGGNVESFCFLPDNQYIIVGVRNDNYLHYINLLNNFEDKKYNMNANGDDWVSFTPMDISPSPNNDGKYLLVSTDDENGKIMLFRTHSAQQIYNYYDDISDNRKFTNPNHCWHPSGKYFFAYGVDSIIRIFDVVTNKVVVKLHGHKNLVRGLWYDDERQLLITCGFDKTVNVWGHDQSLSLEKNNNNNDNNKDIIN
nr:4910_t:CDS:2 [Entrophospora candida]